ncbi:polyprenyl diphosphate synthase [Caulobacter sp. S45]|jgi:undecaprenyl diphosphate synthase|uniref:polyprenyl diphosphate synthase n=1 Tax=Caulobacter sp. S45 TaxID=1641861 RepID=UPI00131BF1DF|nr:polyprenyl diphosphate synthase [Caulobacter sp. S45]
MSPKPVHTVESDAARHVAIIMDGNGRWAKARGLPRTFGHRAGVNALKRTVEAAPDYGVQWLTVFGFSTENWRRPATEVSELMKLMKAYVSSDLDRLAREGVRVHVIGRRDNLTRDILDVIDRAESSTRHNDRFHLQVAFNYGGRADIADAARRYAAAVLSGETPADDGDAEALFQRYLSTAEGPPVDLIIRTSGERRLSNFLLWEAAYAELVFQDVLWPDYGPEALGAAIAEYQARERRYGGAEVDDVLAAG